MLKKFIDKRPNDRIGLVAFATEAYIAAPLTLDHDFVLQNLERLQLGTIDGSSTAIGSGLSTAINRLRELKSKSKIVILMTDGQNNAGKVAPLTVAEAAKALGVKVYTIGVGKRGESRRPRMDRQGRYLADFFGRKIYDPDPEDMDEDVLQEIANMTGGKYYRADNSQRFQAIYAEIDKLEKTEAEVKKFAHHDELFAWVDLARPGAAAAGGSLAPHDLEEAAMTFANPHMLWLLLVDSAGAAGLLLVGRAHAAAIADPVHPGAAVAGVDRRHLRHATEDSRRLPGPGRGLPHSGAGAAAMGLRLGGDQAARAGHRRRH